MDNHFDSKGGGQNVAQGDHAIGKQVNVTQTVRGDGNIFSGTGNVTVNGIPPALFAEYAGKLAVTDSALASFFKILEEQQVPPGDLDAKLREIAATHRELLVLAKGEVRQAIDAGNYAKAEMLLEDVVNVKRYSTAAEAKADMAKLQEVQLRYAKAAEYWQKAAALLLPDQKKERLLYLGNAGYDLYRIARYAEAMPFFKQSLHISQEIGDKAGEGEALSNIGAIHHTKGDYTTALKYLKQSLRIMQEISDKTGEGATLSNIGVIHYAKGDYTTALKYLKQSLRIRQNTGDKAGEGCTLNNISQIYHARGDYATALNHLEQSLRIRQKIGDKAGEGTTLNNISQIYDERGDYATALKYLVRSLYIRQEISDKAGESNTLNNIGKIYQLKGDYAAALPWYNQSLRIRQEIGDKAGEAVTRWNIGRAYEDEDQGDLAKAEPYMSRAVQLAEEIGHPKLEEWRKALAALRAQLKGL
ncbi:MAG: tetratricopeptide repeat protein [Candidatus Electronema sp. V4]|uniref:tetratricopeptide repeat protein n=1 Tax=Candidatus Electronema sp. V4 TaxID=3454756 RepID=UPI0040557423